jgi:hypothetical protein
MIQAVRLPSQKTPIRFGCDQCGGKGKEMTGTTEHPSNPSWADSISHHADHIGMGVLGVGALLVAYLFRRKKKPTNSNPKP